MRKRKVCLIVGLIFVLVMPSSAHSFKIPDFNRSESNYISPASKYISEEVDVEKNHFSMMKLGVKHILSEDSSFFNISTPYLNDHGYLLLGVLLMNGYLVSLLKNCSSVKDYLSNSVPLAELATAFALGHTAGLFFVYFSPVSIPGFLVEGGIALSIALVGFERLASLEDIFDPSLRKNYILLVLIGFIHGNGFAPVVRSVSFSSVTEALSMLLAFTLGVDLGQIFFMSVASIPLMALMYYFGEERSVKMVSTGLVFVGMSLAVFRVVPRVIGFI